MSKPMRKNVVQIDRNLTINPEITFATDGQLIARDHWEDGKNLVLYGCAGTAKSTLACRLGITEVLNQTQRKVIIIRSAVATRNVGFLRGGLGSKIGVYEEPYFGIFEFLFGRGDAYEIMKKKGMVEFTSTSFLRGLTWDNAIVIVDEINNMTFHELDTIITRVGQNSRIIFAGDGKQTDLLKQEDKTGLYEFLDILADMEEFARVDFTTEDILRSGLVKSYIEARERNSF